MDKKGLIDVLNRLSVRSVGGPTVIIEADYEKVADEILNTRPQISDEDKLRELFDELINAGRDMERRDRLQQTYISEDMYFVDIKRRYHSRPQISDEEIEAVYDVLGDAFCTRDEDGNENWNGYAFTGENLVKLVRHFRTHAVQTKEVSDEEITNAGIKYAEDFQLRDAPIQNDKIRSRAVRDFYQGADWHRTHAVQTSPSLVEALEKIINETISDYKDGIILLEENKSKYSHMKTQQVIDIFKRGLNKINQALAHRKEEPPSTSLVEVLELFINADELSDEGYVITASVWDGLVENAKMIIKKNKNR